MLECKPVPTPIEPGYKSTKLSDETPTGKVRFQRLVGKLIYLSHMRLDIGYATSFISQYMHTH